MTTGTILFYGGVALMALALAGGLLCFLRARRASAGLRETLDGEYGPSPEKK